MQVFLTIRLRGNFIENKHVNRQFEKGKVIPCHEHLFDKRDDNIPEATSCGDYSNTSLVPDTPCGDVLECDDAKATQTRQYCSHVEVIATKSLRTSQTG